MSPEPRPGWNQRLAFGVANVVHCRFLLLLITIVALAIVTASPAAALLWEKGASVAAARISCPVTVAPRRPPDRRTPGFDYGNATIRVALNPPDGRLVAGRLPSGGTRATINADGSIWAKYGWWRAGSGKITISGRRIDAPAPPLTADVPDGYGAGFQSSGLAFPTPGCWRITGRYGLARITFTVLVTKSALGP